MGEIPALFADRYTLEGEVRAGGMARVYRAIDGATGARVALKMIVGGDRRDGERFDREAEVLASMVHPAIVRYLDHGVAKDGARFLVMEWLDGEDLSKRLLRAPLTMRETVSLGLRLATALAHAHARGVVHRDVKPGNVFLVDHDVERTKLLDFGIARVDATVGLTRVGMFMGTPGYVAPEQARGRSDVDGRADLFSLGCVLYRCLVGRVAFPGETVVAVLAKILFDEVPPVVESVPDVPAELGALVRSLLAKDPDARPRGAIEVLEALGRSDAALASASERVAHPTMPALTAHERRLVSVILVAGPPPTSDSNRTVTLDTIPLSDLEPMIDPVRAAVAPYGARAERLADGTLVLTMGGAGAATDQAAHAARCALAVRAILPSVPMALATGHGLVGARVPLGDAIDRATRMLSAARAQLGIPIDDVTAGLLDARFEVGGDATAMALLAERPSVDATRKLLGKASPFVGRGREVGALLGLFQECMTEPVARAALVTAAPGMGKSRLRHELLRRIQDVAPTTQVWIARGDAMTRASPFGLLAQIVRRTAGVVDGEPPGLGIRKLRARVARAMPDEDVERVSEFLGELGGVSFPDLERVQLRAARRDPQLLGDQVRRAWEDFVEAEVAVRPLVLVLEDLHWGDLPSVRLVDAALSRSREQPFFVLALARPEVSDTFPALWTERELVALPLGELTRRASEKLVHAVLGDTVDGETMNRLVAHAGGNALYLEELIRAVAEGKADSLPATVLAMVQARVERLEDDARRVLRAASVFGESFWSGGVRALLGPGQSEGLAAWLASLEQREVITCRPETSIANEVEYTFRHALVRDAAYAALTQEDRTLGHKLAAEWLERQGESDASVLAEHFERGDEPERAAELYAVAAEQAIAGNDYVAALAHAARGAGLGASGHTLGILRLRQAEAHHWLGKYAESASRASEAVVELVPGSGPWYAAVGEVGVACARQARTEEALAAAMLLLGTEPHPDGVATCVASAVRIAGGVARLGMQDLTAKLAALVEGLAPSVAHEPSVACRLAQLRAMRAYFDGVHETSVRATREAVAAFARAGDLRNATGQRLNLSASYILLGAYPEGEAEIRRALADAARMGMRHSELVGRLNLVIALARQGHLAEARREGERLAADCSQRDARHLEGNARLHLAEVLVLAVAWEDAEREARKALELLAGTPSLLSHPSALLARCLLASGRHGEALELSREALANLGEQGSGEEDALVRLTHAEALRANGANDEARSVIADAAARVRASAERIGDASLRAVNLARVWENARTLQLATEWAS